MEELYIETENGKIRLDDGIIKKYSLKKGMISPFSNKLIVDKYGNSDFEISEEKNKERHVSTKRKEDGVVELENGIMLTTSEMIDIAQGTDSSTEET